MSRALGLVAFAVTLAVPPAAATAQQQERSESRDTVSQDTVLTREQRIRQRLRSLSPLISPDTTPADSAAADSTAAADSLESTPAFDPNVAGREVGTGLTAANRDSTMLELLRLSGYVGTEYSGDTATYVAADERLVLRGAAEVMREGQRITADTSLIYYDKLAYACAYGSPVVTGGTADSPIRSDSLCYDVNHSIGVAMGAQTEVSEGAVWYVTGDLVTVGERVYSHDAMFTDCSLEEPHYHFGAGSMKVLKNDVMVARDVTLKFGDVPVFWLPFFMQSMKQGRRSGILFPRFGINDIARNSSRYSRSIEDLGFYWAISDHLGAEVAMDWKSDNYTALRGSFDYRFRRQFLNGGTTFRRYWQDGGGTTFTLANNTSWQPDERTSLSASVNYSSSASFIRERSVDPRELTRQIASSANLGRRFDWGSLSLGANRNQSISSGQVRMTLPSVNLTLSPVTLFPALPGEGGPFSNMTWSASARANRSLVTIDEALASETQQNQNEFDGSVNSSFSFGRFSWGQGFSVRQEVEEARTFETDSGEVVELPDSVNRTGSWNTNFSYQQPLIATSSLTPNLSLSGDFARDPLVGSMVAGPTRINFGASLNTDLFGFFPGFGPFEAVRHHISPSFTYTYSPKPTVDERQSRVFGVADSTLSERNTLSIHFNQTFEAKFKEGRGPEQRAPELPLTKADSLAMLPEQERLMLPDSLRQMADSAIAENPALLEPPDTTSGPRRRDTAQKMTLLSINTNALVYDFVRAREDDEGFRTTTLSNTLRSDLLPGFDLRIAHDLFHTPEREDINNGSGVVLPGPEPSRAFSPHLSQVNFGFNINSDSWIARLFGGGDDDEAPADSTAPEPETPEPGAGAEMPGDEAVGDQGLIGGRRREDDQPPSTPVGTWNASLNYSLNRPRNGIEMQMVTGNLRFQPTVNWSVSWNTGYSVTEGRFTDHALTLSRRLHDFDANFDFYKAQNGNFTFQFRVHLRANPDMKFDYDQRELRAIGTQSR